MTGASHPANPLIVQSDRAILLEVDSPRYEEARDALAAFAELEKSPEHIHTYRVTPLSIWNACAAGHSGDAIIDAMRGLSKYPPPEHVLTEIHDFASRYGRLRRAITKTTRWRPSTPAAPSAADRVSSCCPVAPEKPLSA